MGEQVPGELRVSLYVDLTYLDVRIANEHLGSLAGYMASPSEVYIL